tara:strand:+ start:3106 stop:3903 length:798 start_codon:yes stop_codon:yes gene_type:complete
VQQSIDFREESLTLKTLIADLDDVAFEKTTQFKSWTINDVLRHLHFWNKAVMVATEGDEAFSAFFEGVGAHMTKGGSLPEYEKAHLEGLSGGALREAWASLVDETADAYAVLDPSARVPWAGPSMSARSAISARQMETWAHGQEVFDALAADREEHDRIRNIVILGINTFGWTFKVRGEIPPEPMPNVSLVSPSGELWAYGESQHSNFIQGDAVEFAQVVTQTRNIADTSLTVIGDPAKDWMSKAQCFAGGASPPPAKGSRFRAG